MENKELTRRQARYLDILSKFNFQIIFRARTVNSKVDALIRMLLSISANEADKRSQH